MCELVSCLQAISQSRISVDVILRLAFCLLFLFYVRYSSLYTRQDDHATVIKNISFDVINVNMNRNDEKSKDTLVGLKEKQM